MGWGNESLFSDPCHVTQMAAMPIYGKNPLKIFSEINRLITFELSTCIQQWVLSPYRVCSNDDPGLSLIYLTARATLLPNAFLRENA